MLAADQPCTDDGDACRHVRPVVILRMTLSKNRRRSTPEIVEAANGLLAASTGRALDLRAQRPSGPTVSYTARPDEVAEADAVAAQVARLRDGGRSLGEVAILFRINAQSESFEEALSARAFLYVVRGGAARFFDRPEVREAVTRLRGAARSGEGADDGVVQAVTGILGGMGWTADPPTGRGQTRDRSGVLAGAGRPGDRVRPHPGLRRPAHQRLRRRALPARR